MRLSLEKLTTPGPSSVQLSPGFRVVFEKISAILRTSDLCLGQHRITKRRHEASQKGKRAAQANSAASVFDTEWSKSSDFRVNLFFASYN